MVICAIHHICRCVSCGGGLSWALNATQPKASTHLPDLSNLNISYMEMIWLASDDHTLTCTRVEPKHGMCVYVYVFCCLTRDGLLFNKHKKTKTQPNVSRRSSAGILMTPPTRDRARLNQTSWAEIYLFIACRCVQSCIPIRCGRVFYSGLFCFNDFLIVNIYISERIVWPRARPNPKTPYH